MEILAPCQVDSENNKEEKQAKRFKDAKERILKIADSIKTNEIDKSNKVGGIKKAVIGSLYSTFFKPHNI